MYFCRGLRREWLGYYYWMEKDLVLKVLGKLQYPWLYRHDRRLYEKHPEVDPLNLVRQIFLSSLLGFWVGKAFKKRQFLFAAIFALPSIAIFLNNQYKLAKTLPNFLDVPVTKTTKIVPLQSPTTTKKEDKKQAATAAPQYSNRKQLPQLQLKIYNAKDFISQLPKSYFH